MNKIKSVWRMWKPRNIVDVVIYLWVIAVVVYLILAALHQSGDDGDLPSYF